MRGEVQVHVCMDPSFNIYSILIPGLFVTSSFLKSKIKEPSKLLSSSGMRGGKSIYVKNFSAQEHALSKTGPF